MRQECQELLGQLSVSFFALIDWTRYLKAPRTLTDKEAATVTQRYDSSVVDLHRIVGSRLLIANEIKSSEIRKRWQDAVDSYIFDYDEENLNSAYESMVDDIVKIGLQC